MSIINDPSVTEELDPVFAAWLAGPPNVSVFTNDAGYALASNVVPTSRTLTINGTAYDLSADRSWTIASGPSFGTTTQIPYMNAGGTDFLYSAGLASDGTRLTTTALTVDTNTIYVNATDHRVGIGTATPEKKLDVRADVAAGINIPFVVTNGAGTTLNDEVSIGFKSSADFTTGYFSSRIASVQPNAGNNSADLVFYTWNGGIFTGAEMLRIKHTGNIILPTDNQKLLFGSANDASIYYDGTNMVFNSREVGTGDFIFSGGYVGIGTTTPKRRLHLYAGNSGVDFSTGVGSNSLLVFEGASDTAGALMDAVFPDNQVGGFRFDCPTSNTRGGVIYYGPTAVSSGYTFQDTLAFVAGATWRMVIQAGGNVGIGTTSPGSQLTLSINATQGNSSVSGLSVTNTNAGGYANTIWNNDLGDLGQFLMTGSTGSIGATTIRARQAVFTSVGGTGGLNFYTSAGPIYFTPGGGTTEKITMLTDGKVGIGTTSPGNRLVVVDSLADLSTLLLQNTSTTGYSAIQMNNSAGSAKAVFGYGNSAVSTAAKQGLFYLSSYTGSGFSFFSSTETEIVRITDAGNVILNTDNQVLLLGTGNDSGFYYDGTNTIWKNYVGSGKFDLQMVLQTDGYNSVDGSAGVSGSFTTVDLKTVTVKDGLITSIV